MGKTSSKKRRIMYIDDDPNLIDMIEKILGMLNYDVVTSMDSLVAFKTSLSS